MSEISSQKIIAFDWLHNVTLGGVWWELCPSHSLAIEGVGSRDYVGAVLAHQEANPVIESLQVGLRRGHLCLLDDVQGVRGAHTQRGGVTGCLQTAVWIHTVH